MYNVKNNVALTAVFVGHAAPPPVVAHVMALAAVKNVIVKRNFNILFIIDRRLNVYTKNIFHLYFLYL